jgi:hypothetical protein
MKKLKVALVISVMLNILLITAMALVRNIVYNESVKSVVTRINSEISIFEYTLNCLESDDPNNLEKLKFSFKETIESDKKELERISKK